jgi:hypothetical protein
MPKSGIFSFYSSHVCFANNLVFRTDVHFIDTIAIRNPEITLPNFNHQPQRFKGFTASIAYNPSQNTFAEVINCCPYPNYVFFDPTNVCSSSSSPTSGTVSTVGYSGN